MDMKNSRPQRPPSDARLEQVPSRQGRSGPRSRNGCWTCRAKKVKCDENRPVCMRCTRLDLVCNYEPRRRPIGNYCQETSTQPYDRSTTTPPAPAEEYRTVVEVPGAEDRDIGADARPYWMEPHGTSPYYHKTARYTHLPLFELSAPNVGASSVELTIDDHESIRYYRTSFSKLYHTKNPRYSLFSVMLTVAERSEVVMHMILALASSEIDLKRGIGQGKTGGEAHQDARPISKLKSRALHHYSVALRLMADVVGQGAEAGVVDLDCILTALYLMLMYEQMFGNRQGLSNHLTGAAIIVRHHCAHLVQPRLPGPKIPGGTTQGQQQLAFSQTAQPGSKPQISQYSARLLARVALSDAAVTTYGIGGEVISALYDAMGLHVGDSLPRDSLESIESLERDAVTLYRNVWGESYPQDELAEDIENRPVFAFYGTCLQLRFMISQLSNIPDHGGDAAARSFSSVYATIQATGARFAELLTAAVGLSLATDNSHRLVTNIRFVVPHYHAVILEFLRLTAVRRPGLTLDEGQRVALHGIMTLAVQAFRHEGDEAMLRIAQPLFMVGLETDDVLHREWVLERFEKLGRFGARFERARAFLLETIETQQALGRRVDVRERFRLQGKDPDVFVF